MDKHRRERLEKFVSWADANIKGDEKGEAQIFLDRLLQAFGQPGLLEIGQTEFRIRPDAASEGGTKFADFVWKPVVLIEMKKRGVDLARHTTQAFSYWTTLAPGRPRYVILCNFDELWIYDPDESIYEPADKLKPSELPEHHEAATARTLRDLLRSRGRCSRSAAFGTAQNPSPAKDAAA